MGVSKIFLCILLKNKKTKIFLCNSSIHVFKDIKTGPNRLVQPVGSWTGSVSGSIHPKTGLYLPTMQWTSNSWV